MSAVLRRSIRVVSLFSGGGFAEESLRLASEKTGIATEVVMAVDSWEPAARVRDANLPGVRTTIASVKDIHRSDLPPHDLVIGGPPCQPWSVAGKRGGADDPRDCLPDFVRLRGDVWLMENVTSRLLERMGGGWSEKFCASDFGDVTSRKRWFYSSHLLHVVPTPGPKRIRDIRDHDEDARVIAKRGYWVGDEMQAVVGDDEMFNTLCASDFHGTKNNGSGKPTRGSKIGCKAGNHEHYDDSLDSLTAHAWHGHDVRGFGKLLALTDDAVMPTIKATQYHAAPMNGDRMNRWKLRLGLRGNSASASASAFDDDEVLGSLLSNAFHANEASKLVGCRNPSLLEMARAHSIPDTWDWAGTTKTQRGQIIANGWPIGMGTAICVAMLQAMVM